MCDLRQILEVNEHCGEIGGLREKCRGRNYKPISLRKGHFALPNTYFRPTLLRKEPKEVPEKIFLN